VDQNQTVLQQKTDMRCGVVSVNEVRSECGLPPVPWLALNWISSFPVE